MPDLATQIRELIEGSAPPVTLDEVKGRVHVLEDADPIGWQIRELIEGSAPPITLDEVKGRVRTPHRSNRSRTAGRHRSRRLALAVSIPLVLAMIGLSTFLAPGSTPPAAAAVLEQASSVAAALPAATPPGPGQYLYFTSTQEVLESLSPPTRQQPITLQATMTTQTWVATDGSGRQVVTFGPWAPLLASDDAAWAAEGSPQPSQAASTDTTFPTSSVPYSNGPISPRSGSPITVASDGQAYLTYPSPAGMPTDVAALQAYLVNRYSTAGSIPDLFQVAGEILQEGTSPQVRAALFNLIRSLPGITFVGPAVDQTGDHGIGVALDNQGSRYTLIFDPQTSQVFGLTTVSQQVGGLGGAGVPAGTNLGFINFGPSVTVDSTTTVPTATS